jgi:hypothetical protein
VIQDLQHLVVGGKEARQYQIRDEIDHRITLGSQQSAVDGLKLPRRRQPDHPGHDGVGLGDEGTGLPARDEGALGEVAAATWRSRAIRHVAVIISGSPA